MDEKILSILKGINPGIDYTEETQLIDKKLLDSFDIVNLVVELNDNFDIDINVDELIPENFNSINGIKKLIKFKQSET